MIKTIELFAGVGGFRLGLREVNKKAKKKQQAKEPKQHATAPRHPKPKRDKHTNRNNTTKNKRKSIQH